MQSRIKFFLGRVAAWFTTGVARWPGSRVLCGGHEAGAFDASFVLDFSFVALLEVCVLVSSLSVCARSDGTVLRKFVEHFVSEKYTKLACLFSASYFVREVSGLSRYQS